MTRIISLVIGLLFLFSNPAFSGTVDKVIFQSGINRSSVSVSVKDVKTGKIVYKLNDKQPKNPASTLKLITLNAALDTLGSDYQFSTKLYKSTNNDLYIKLSGDPFFTSKNLNKLFETAKSKNIYEPKNIYIDDSIFDSVEWGEGWQWDDDLNVLMPKFSSYNIDGNILNVSVIPTSKGSPAQIYTQKFYPVTFMNLVTTGDSNNVKISRNNSISPDIINIEGTVKKQIEKQIPVNNPKRYFKLRTEDAIKSVKLGYYGKLLPKRIPEKNIYLVDEINHSISVAIPEILKNSNNFVAESVFKAAGAKFANNTGTAENSKEMLNSYLGKLGLNWDCVKIVDGSGVSKNNLVTSDFMTNFLIKLSNNEEFINSLAIPGEGTLANRMLYFKDDLRAKTGTLSDVSSIAGYITTRKGKKYVFDIMINDPKSTNQDKKSLEEYILREIYSKY